jgi:hypothetical protein
MSAPRDSSSSTNSSCPPAHASVRAVSWLLSVSESTSMQEKGAWEHGVPGYEVPEGYCATPGHKISNYLSFFSNIQTFTKSTGLGFNIFIYFHIFQSILKSEVMHTSFKFLRIFRWFKRLKFLDLEPKTDNYLWTNLFLICNFYARTFFRLVFRQKFTS